MKNMVKQGFSLLAALALAMGLSVTAFAAESSVTWEPEKQVSFERGSDYSATDLFDNFKGMMPGDSTSQTITLTNNSDFDYIPSATRSWKKSGTMSVGTKRAATNSPT